MIESSEHTCIRYGSGEKDQSPAPRDGGGSTIHYAFVIPIISVGKHLLQIHLFIFRFLNIRIICVFKKIPLILNHYKIILTIFQV